MSTFLQSPAFRTLALLFIVAAVIVAALITRPGWSGQDIATFVGGLIVVMLSTFSHASGSAVAAGAAGVLTGVSAAKAPPAVDPEP